VAGSCEHDNEPSSSINGSEFLDQLNKCQLLKDFSPWSQSVTKSANYINNAIDENLSQIR